MLRKVANCPFSPRQSPSSSGFRLLAVGHVGTRRRRLRRSRAEAPVRLQQGSVGPVAPTVGVRLAGQAKRRRRACLAGARTAAARAQAQSSSTRCPVEMRPSSGASCAHHVRSRWSTIPSGRAQCNLGTSGGTVTAPSSAHMQGDRASPREALSPSEPSVMLSAAWTGQESLQSVKSWLFGLFGPVVNAIMLYMRAFQSLFRPFRPHLRGQEFKKMLQCT